MIPAGLDAGALASPFSDGFADPFATYQGVWGLALQPFPFAAAVVAPVPVVPQPPVDSTIPAEAPPAPAPPAQAVVVVASFTG